MSDVPPLRAGSAVARALLVVVAVALAVAAVTHRLAWDRAHRETTALLASTGLAVRQPDVAAIAASDPDPVRARLAIARGLLAEAYDPRAFDALPAREAAEAMARVGERLDVARSLAADAFTRLPAAWQAAMIVGGATYRAWSLAGDRRILSDRARWERPLRAAARLAPGEEEPLRPLAVAWLEIWPYLSPGERRDARATLRPAFDDPQTFALCAGLWLAAEPDREKAFAFVPDSTWAWSDLERIYAKVGDWDGYCLAAARDESALRRELEARLREAGERLRRGDPAGARQLAVGVVAAAPADLRFAEVVREALVVCPAGPVSGARDAFHRWLGLALAGFVRGERWLPPEAVARLAEGAGELSDPTRALADLAAGDVVRAEVIERRAEDLNTERWAPYWVGKALVLARVRRAPGAAEALARVNRSWRGSVPLLDAGVAVRAAAGDARGLASARAELAAASASEWHGTVWQWRGDVAWSDLLAARPAAGLVVTIDQAPARGAAVRVSLDGRAVALAPAPSAGPLRVDFPVSAGPHLLEVTAAAGGRVVPGRVALGDQ